MQPSRFPQRDRRPLGGASTSSASTSPLPTPPAPPSVLDLLDRNLEQTLLPIGAAVPLKDKSADGSHDANANDARVEQLKRLLAVQERELRKREAEVVRLRNENRQMHHFLADYGMRWVGDAGELSGRATPVDAVPLEDVVQTAAPQLKSACSTNAATYASPPAETHCPPDIERIRCAIRELNEVAAAAAGEEVVQRADGSHGLQQKLATLPLTVWRNGLQLSTGPLRAWEEASTGSFLRDLLDGYFPYELKHAYPDGVQFELHDRGGSDHGSYDWGHGRTLDSRGTSGTSGLYTTGLLACGSSEFIISPVDGTSGVACYTSDSASCNWRLPSSMSPLTEAATAVGPTMGGAAVGESSRVGAGTGGGPGTGTGLPIKAPQGGVACVLEGPAAARAAAAKAAEARAAAARAAEARAAAVRAV